MVWVKRILVVGLKLLLLAFVTMMIALQVPELQYDFGVRTPVEVTSADDLSIGRFARPTFVSIHGRPDLAKAAVYASHGVPFTYFLLEGYGTRIVVRAPEKVDQEWADIGVHLGRLRPYHRMPFSQSVGAGFQQLFGVEIADDAFFLARDDAPRPSGWTIGAVAFAGILWCALAYFFFIHGRVARYVGCAVHTNSPAKKTVCTAHPA